MRSLAIAAICMICLVLCGQALEAQQKRLITERVDAISVSTLILRFLRAWSMFGMYLVKPVLMNYRSTPDTHNRKLENHMISALIKC